MAGATGDVEQRSAILLERGEELLGVLEAAAWPMWLASLDGQCIHFNDAWLNLTGRTLEQERGSGWLDGVHPGDRERVRDVFVESVAAQRNLLCRYRVRCADGEYRWVEDQGRPIRDRCGDAIGYAGSVQDLSAQWRRDEAVRELEKRSHVHSSQFEALFDAVPVIVWIAHDVEGRWITGNQASREFLQLPEGANPSLTAAEAARPAHYRVIHQGREVTGADLPVQKVANSGRAMRNCEMIVEFADGRRSHLRGNIEPLRDRAGDPQGAIGAFADISDLVNTREELIRREKRFRETVANSLAGFFLIDSQGRFADVNQAWLDIHGYERREDVVGRHFSLIALPHTGPMLEACFKRVLSGESLRAVDNEIVRPNDGQRRHLAFSARPTFVDGQLVEIDGFVIDITERKLSERALRDAHDLLEQRVAERTEALAAANEELLRSNNELLRIRSLLENISEMLPGMVFLQDESTGGLIYTNRGFRGFFLRGDQPDGNRIIHSRIASDDLMVLDRLYQRLKTPSEVPATVEAELRARDHDGTERRMLFCLTRFGDGRDGKREILGVIVDVTDSRLAELATRRGERLVALGTFTAGVAHEINNPLGTILLHADLIEDEVARLAAGPTVAESLGEIKQAATRCAGIVKRVLEFSRPKTTTLESCQLSEVMEFVVKMTSHLAGNSGVELCIEEPERPPPVRANRAEIEQVLINLVHNAIQARSSRIVLRGELTPERDRVTVCIDDDGEGMTEHQVKRVTDPFYTTRLGEGGTGLGLSICERILRDHGSQLLIQSVPDLGTSMRFSLPICESDHREGANHGGQSPAG
ncbi:MAG: PAS domain S-box protein [Phycisphaeraceae bacterium]|nr:PAS domain S-box protein [Phycisphaeraceae bacterium]